LALWDGGSAIEAAIDPSSTVSASGAGEALDRATDKVRAEGGSVEEARKEVEDDEMTLEECKKRLAKVQQDLARLEADETGAVQRHIEAEAEVRKAERLVAASQKDLEARKVVTAKELKDLNEAKAASAFHSAAKAHLQSQLVHTEMNAEDHGAESKLKQFEDALSELKVTHSETVSQKAVSARSQKAAAFAKARKAAKALLEMGAPPT